MEPPAPVPASTAFRPRMAMEVYVRVAIEVYVRVAMEVYEWRLSSHGACGGAGGGARDMVKQRAVTQH